MGRLEKIDLTQRLSREEETVQLAVLQNRMLELRLACGGMLGDGRLGPPVLVMFEGWDASGKGGAIKRLVSPLDPRHVRVAQFAAPTPDEKRHHFLIRFNNALPGWGGMAVFDRTWYGRVLVERVEEFARKEQWQRAYSEITNFERGLADEGTVILKFWMHISLEEQLKRFERRRQDPLRQWKLTEEDWRNRERHDDYLAAVEEMLKRTDHKDAPWIPIAGESKRHARVEVLKHTVKAIEDGMTKWGLDLPNPIQKVG